MDTYVYIHYDVSLQPVGEGGKVAKECNEGHLGADSALWTRPDHRPHPREGM